MHKKFTKRLLCRISAAILSLVLLFSALPMTAFAANGYYQLKIGLPGKSFWAVPFMKDDNVYWFNGIGVSDKEALTDSNGNVVGWNAYFEKSTKTLHLRNIECGFIFITDGCNKIELEGVNSILSGDNFGISCVTPDDGKLQIYSKGNTEATLNISVYKNYSESQKSDICGIGVIGRKYGRDYNGLLEIAGKTNVNIEVSLAVDGSLNGAYGIYADDFKMYGKSLDIKYQNFNQNKDDNITTFFGIYCYSHFNNPASKIYFQTQTGGTVNIDCHEAAYGYPFSGKAYEFDYVKSLKTFAGYSRGYTFCNTEPETEVLNDSYIVRQFRLPEYSIEVFELNRQFESLGKAKVKVVGANFLYKLYNNDGFTYHTVTGMDTADFYKNDWINIKAIDYESSGKKFESWRIFDMYDANNELTSEYLNTAQQKQEQIIIIPSDGETKIKEVLCVVPRYKYLVSIIGSAQGNVEVSGVVSDKAWVGADPVTLTAEANEGYQFSHWKLFDSKGMTSKDDGAIYPDFTDAQLKNKTITLPADIGYNYQIQPIFELKDYTITYRYEKDGSWISIPGRIEEARWKSGANIVNTYKTGDTTVLPRANDVVYRGYKFMGWYADRNFSGSPITFIRADWRGNKVFYAKFEKDSNADYDITVNPKGDYSVSGGNISVTAAEAKAGQIVYFTVDPNPGFAINSEMSISVKSGSTAISCTKVSGTDNLYSFVMPSGNVTVNVTNPFKLCQYTITYNANGGRPYGWSDLPDEYNVRGENCKLVDDDGNKIKLIFNTDIPAFRKGYIFAGWCRTADCSDEPITSIPLDGTISGNLTLYACWVKTDHPVNVNINSIDNVEYARVKLDKERYSMGEKVKFMIEQVGRSMVKNVEIVYTDTTDTGAYYTVRKDIVPDSSGFYNFIMPGLEQGKSESKLTINVYSYPICDIEYNDDGGKVTFSSALGGSIITCLKEGLICVNVTARPGYKKGADFKLFANGKEITLNPGFSYYTIPINDHTTITVSGVEETGLLYGDVNTNGKLDVADLVRLKKYIAGVSGFTFTEEQLVLADVNLDGDINAGDLVELRKILLIS